MQTQVYTPRILTPEEVRCIEWFRSLNEAEKTAVTNFLVNRDARLWDELRATSPRLQQYEITAVGRSL